MSDIAIRELVFQDQEAILRSILSASDYGVMLTDLDHVTIACNKKFGELFGVDIVSVVHSDVLGVRHMVEKLIPDVEVWEKDLDFIYQNPRMEKEDELVLLHDAPMNVRRFTGPVLDAQGKVVGRLWTFLDISAECRRRTIRDTLFKLSTIYDEDPRVVYKSIVETVAKHYSSNAILSILHGDMIEFRVVASQVPVNKDTKTNTINDSFCQFAIEAAGPVVIQDALTDERYCTVLPARLGLTRYLGVPINDPSGKVIGTLCLLDSSSEKILDEDDLQFMSLLAMRVSAELAREAYLTTRIAEKQAVVEAQGLELQTTRQVLVAMNKAFELLESEEPLQGLILKQLTVMKGLLGYGQIGLFVESGSNGTMCGGAISETHAKPIKMSVSSPLELSRLFAPDHSIVVPLRNLPGHQACLVLSSSTPTSDRNSHHEAHLEAIVEQVSLLIASHLLRQELSLAYSELKSTHEQMVQSEKLSVVGTLASSTAHDIKNILSSMTLELAQGIDDPDRALTAVKGHLDRFSVLAHRLLSYAKPRLVAMQPLALDDLIYRVLALTAAHTRVTNVTVVFNKAESLTPILGDPHQVEHLFVNLVLNAVQAMHDQGGTLTITIKTLGTKVEVEVQDTGGGLTKDAEWKLFKPFSSTRLEGFGLGLYSCRRIIEEHGGEIKVWSKPGKGTRFTVTLMAVKEQ